MMYESFSLNWLLECTMNIHITMQESIQTKGFTVQSKNLIQTKKILEWFATFYLFCVFLASISSLGGAVGRTATYGFEF